MTPEEMMMLMPGMQPGSSNLFGPGGPANPGGTPPIMPGPAGVPSGPMPGAQQNRFQQFMGSPGAAMMFSALQNLSARNTPGGRQQSPVAAYQRAVQLQHGQKMQELANQRAQQAEMRAQEKHDADMDPASEYKNLVEQGLLPEGMTYQEFVNSGLGTGKSGKTSAMQNWNHYEKLAAEDPQKAERFAYMVGLNLENRRTEGLSSTNQSRYGKLMDKQGENNLLMGKVDELENRMANIELPSGYQGNVSEFIKQALGTEDEISQIRTQWRNIRNSFAIQNLPPGVASDKDIEIAMAGFPDDFSNKEQIESFLRGLRKLTAIENEFNNFQLDYMDENDKIQGVRTAWKEYQENKYGDNTGGDAGGDGWGIQRN